MRSLVLSPEAIKDIRSARAWYEHKRSGLGAEFEQALEASLMRIRRLPESLRQVGDGFHRISLRRFPCDVYFEYDDRRVVVAIVFHTARDPATVLARLQRH